MAEGGLTHVGIDQKRPPRSFAKGDDPITPYQFALRPPKRSDFNDSYIGIVERKSLNALGQSLNKWLLGPQPNDRTQLRQVET
jgi:hypothetical protein